MENLELKVEADFYKISINFDLEKLNNIMMNEHGAKKAQKKNRRSLKFTNPTTTRDFIFHLKRMFHELNCSKKVPFDQTKPPLKVAFKAK
jgi:hypothetical protein